MIQRISHVSLLVPDQEEALKWYVDKLDFEVKADQMFPDGRGRWVTIGPINQQDLEVTLELPEWGGGDSEARRSLIGRSPGWVLLTDDCRRDHETFQARGVNFLRSPEELPWGISAVFEDLYGTVHNLLEPRED